MSYFVIDKECANKIYDNDDFEISLKKFKSEEEANNYLNGVTKSPMLISLEKKILVKYYQIEWVKGGKILKK